MNKITPSVRILIIINATLFLLDSMTLYDMNSVLALYSSENGSHAIWQYISSIFMHGSVIHILFNMMGLWVFGTALEQAWGSQKFLVLYFVAGIGAGIISNLANSYDYSLNVAAVNAVGMHEGAINTLLEAGRYIPHSGLTEQMMSDLYQSYHTRTVGASGALYGVIVAFTMHYPNVKMQLLFIPFPIASKYFVPLLISIDLLSVMTGVSLFGEGIAHFAHLGGALIGLFLMFFWLKTKH